MTEIRKQRSMTQDIRGLYHAMRAPKTLFLLSHMRSNSTLFSHILGSNSRIAGYRELHLKYRSNKDLLKLKYRLRQDASHAIPKYLHDKILHEKLTIADKFLRSENFRFIVTIREPERTIKSIVAMASKNKNLSFDTAEKASKYYMNRLDGLVRMSNVIPKKNAMFLSSEMVVSDTNATLETLSAWLQLEEPLSPKYNIFEHTGKRFGGDPSENISHGEVRHKNPDIYDKIKIPDPILESAAKKYEDTYEKIKSRLGREI